MIIRTIFSQKNRICHIETLLRACAALDLQLDISPLENTRKQDEGTW
ncbi:hypothetical protein [Erwinia aphidicola]